jgi:hypothetical protein
LFERSADLVVGVHRGQRYDPAARRLQQALQQE